MDNAFSDWIYNPEFDEEKNMEDKKCFPTSDPFDSMGLPEEVPLPSPWPFPTEPPFMPEVILTPEQKADIQKKIEKKLGQNPKDLLGTKKVDFSVVPPAGEIHLARAMMNGAEKYGAFNWRENAVIGSIYHAAARRHLMSWLDGEEDADDSGVHHLGHVMACCAIILDAMETGNLIDDRPVKGKASEILARYTKK